VTIEAVVAVDENQIEALVSCLQLGTGLMRRLRDPLEAHGIRGRAARCQGRRRALGQCAANTMPIAALVRIDRHQPPPPGVQRRQQVLTAESVGQTNFQQGCGLTLCSQAPQLQSLLRSDPRRRINRMALAMFTQLGLAGIKAVQGVRAA